MLIKINTIKILIKLALIKLITAQQSPIFRCIKSGTICTFADIILNSTNYNWQPTSNSPNFVQTVKFTGSRIPVITNNICESFPNLEVLYLSNLQIERLEENAFTSCANLEYLYLFSNKLHELPSDIFRYNNQLKYLYLYDNQLKSLDSELFENLSELVFLNIGNKNNLTEFSPELVRNNKNLRELYLYSNDLSDIDVEQIMEYLPNLRKLYLEDNEISCTRLVEVCQVLRANNVTCGVGYSAKIRYYPVQTVYGNLRCNPDISWMASNYRKANSMREQRLRQNLVEMENKISVLEQDIKENFDRFNNDSKDITRRLTKLNFMFDKMEQNLDKIMNLLLDGDQKSLNK